MRRFVRESALSIFFLALLLATMAGQSIAGWKQLNEEAVTHHGQTISWARYLVSSDFGEAVMENWQSEFMQFSLFIIATVWLLQKGSNESKEPGEEGLESDQKQRIGGFAPENAPRWAKTRGWRTAIYQNSLMILMTLIFFLTWAAQSITGWSKYNDEQKAHDEAPIHWVQYLAKPVFWNNTLQNWQSEFLAIGTMAVFTIYLRQRGSPESKPVGAPHDETGSSG